MKTEDWIRLVVICGILFILFLVSMATESKAFEYRKPTTWGIVYDAEVTAYNADEAQTDDRPWEMANGEEVYIGAVACPSFLEFGEQVYINGETYTCADRMNKRYRDGNYFDILVETEEEALNFGRQNLEVIKII